MNKQDAIEKLKTLDRMFEESPTGAIKEAIEALEFQLKTETTLRNNNYSSVNHLLLTASRLIEKQRWIPVSERLPEESGMYLLTADVLGRLEVQYCFYQLALGFICNGKSVAWMKIPEPYKEGI